VTSASTHPIPGSGDNESREGDQYDGNAVIGMDDGFEQFAARRLDGDAQLLRHIQINKQRGQAGHMGISEELVWKRRPSPAE
jgi:hypothetical protein